MPFVFNPFTGNFDTVSDPIEDAFTFAADCTASELVHDVVRISADVVAGVFQVRKVDVSDSTKMPGIGIIIEKPTASTAIVVYLGAVTLVGPLLPGKVYFIGADSKPSSTCPSGPALVQPIGFALDATRLLFKPSMTMVRVL
jgi:hypothetical protein